MKQLLSIAEIKVSYTPKKECGPPITQSQDAEKIFREFFDHDTIGLQEQFYAMYLNRANQVIGVYKLSLGGITGTVVDPRLILLVALKSAATGIILAHNHPSGNLKASQPDINLTEKVKEAANLMDIKVLDHLILAPKEGAYISFADDGRI
ncbi:MAG: JAB domain-containing protein [Chitinophagales bacterium]|nr:JAB domain-containing protein [Chitinophagales bacterium]